MTDGHVCQRCGANELMPRTATGARRAVCGVSRVSDDPPALKFADQYVQPILRGHKTATIRLELDGPFTIGTRFHLCREDGERFASAFVTDRGYNDARSIVRYGVDGHKDYRDVEDFIRHLSRFYPDADIGGETCFEIVYWDHGDLWE